MKTIIITGGAGTLAQHMIKFLQEKYGDNIHIITTLKKREELDGIFIYDKNSVQFCFHDIKDTSILIWQYKPDYFLNFAAISSPTYNKFEQEILSINAESVYVQLDTINKYSKHTRYLNAGSSEEILGQNFYANSKRIAHKYVEKYRNKHNIFAIQPIIYNFTSFLQKDSFLFPKIAKETYRIFKEIKNNEKITPMFLGNLRVSKSFLWVDEVVEKLWDNINQDDLLFREYLEEAIIRSDEQICLKNIVEQAFMIHGIWGVWTNNCQELNHPIDDVFVTYRYIIGKKLEVVNLVEVNPKFCRENEKNVEYIRENNVGIDIILQKFKNFLTK